MGLNRNRLNKSSCTGGKNKSYRKKRKYELGRNPAHTKLGAKRVTRVRVRGGSFKHRAIKIDEGNFSWPSEGIARKTRIIDVVYNASSNELVRTKSITKNTIVLADAGPFRTWYQNHYGVELGKKKKQEVEDDTKTPVKPKGVQTALNKIDPLVAEEFNGGRLLACIASRPGQCGKADGYILEGAELAFYKKKLEKKKGK